MTTVCTVSGTLKNLQGETLANTSVGFQRKGVVSQYGDAIIPYDVQVVSDGSGFVSFDIYPGNYVGTASPVSGRVEQFTMAVPETAAEDIADLIGGPAESITTGLSTLTADLAQEVQDRIAGDDAHSEGTYYAGPWDASTGAFPSVRGAGGAVQLGDYFDVSVAGTVDGQAFEVGERIKALVDTPSTTTLAANWYYASTIAILEPLNDAVDELQDDVAERALDYGPRNATNAAKLAANGNGTIGWLGGLQYLVDSTATGSGSATNDLGVNGLVPFGEVYAEHYGYGSGSGAENATAIQSAIDNSGGGKVVVRTVATVEGNIYLRTDVVFDNHGYPITINNGGFRIDGVENGEHVSYWEAKVDVIRTGSVGPAIYLGGDDTVGENKAAIRGRLFPIVRSSSGSGIKMANAYILDIFHPQVRNCNNEGWLFTFGTTGNVGVNAVSIYGGETQQCERFMIARGVSGVNWYGHTPEGNNYTSYIDQACRGMRFYGGYWEKNAFDTASGSGNYDLVVQKVTQLIRFDSRSGTFNVGDTLTGGTSGATATILEVYDEVTEGAFTYGRLLLESLTGTFVNDDPLSTGSATATANGGSYGSSPINIVFDGIEFWEGQSGNTAPIRLVHCLKASIRNCRAGSTAWTYLFDFDPSSAGQVTGEYGNNYVGAPTVETNVTPNTYFAPYDDRQKRITGSFTWEVGTLASGAITSTTETISGLSTGDFVEIQRNGPNSSILITAYVSAADTLQVYASNQGNSSVTLGLATFRVLVTPKNYFY